MDTTKAKSRGISSDMSPSAVESRLKAVDELRELAFELSRAQRLGPVEAREDEFDLPTTPIQESVDRSAQDN